MKGPDPRKEPQSETAEKASIHKTHEEFIGNEEPSLTKQEYEKRKEREKLENRKPGDRTERSKRNG